MRKRVPAEIAKKIGRIQDLIGRAQAAYNDDRATDRADRVIAALSEAFDLAVEVNSWAQP